MRPTKKRVLWIAAGAAALIAPGVARLGTRGAAQAQDSARHGAKPDTPPPAPGVPPQTNDGPLRFQDMSNTSGGPVNFGNPVSNVEKCTCAFFDADGDGWDDLVTLAGRGEPFRYFLNRAVGDAERGGPADINGRMWIPAPDGNGLDTGPALDRDGSSITVGDVDNDGDEDLYVGCGFNDTLPAGSGRNMLFLNDGAGGFTDAAPALGVADFDSTTAACLFFDMDMDGDLDLIFCNSNFPDASKLGDGLTHLFRNTLSETGALGFVDETAERGIVTSGTAVWAMVSPDYDNDGDLDLVISHDISGITHLFRNDGTGHFGDATLTSGSGAGDDATPSTFGDDSINAMGTSVADIDGDGDLDLYISDLANPMYVNQGDGTFTERGETLGVRGGTVGWGVSFADFDIDGHVDLYVAGGDFWDESRPPVRCWLFRNNGNDGDGTPSFTDVWGGSSLRRDYPLHRESGTATADFDRDGRPDMLVTRAERAGASPYLYRNISAVDGRHWLEVKLVGGGVATNTSALGAKVRIYPRDASGLRIPRIVHLREVEGGDSRASRSSVVQHAGLGEDAVTADVEVEWPRAGDLASRTVLYQRLPVDVMAVIREVPGADSWRLVAEDVVSVPDARQTVFRCKADGVADPLVDLSVPTGPWWMNVGPWQDGRTVRVRPPRVDVPKEYQAVLRAEPQASIESVTSQSLTVRVVPAPSITKIARSGKAAVRVDGDHLDLPGAVVDVNGVVCVLGKVKDHRRKDGTVEQRARVKLPKAIRKLPKRSKPVLTFTESEAGFSASLTY